MSLRGERDKLKVEEVEKRESEKIDFGLLSEDNAVLVVRGEDRMVDKFPLMNLQKK